MNRDSAGRFQQGRRETPIERAARAAGIRKAYESGKRRPTRFFLGRKLSEEHRKHVSDGMRGVSRSRLTRRRMSLALRTLWQDPEYRSRMIAKKIGLKQSPAHIASRLPHISGEQNANWKGGITPLVRRIRTLPAMTRWRTACLTRDGCRCACGSAYELEVDHIVPFSVIMAAASISTLEHARRCEALWDIGNGRTLCKPCHRRLQQPTTKENVPVSV